MIEIRMPLLSPTMEAASLSRWLMRPGDRVRKGDAIAEVETDKATLEVESTHDGVILRMEVAEGADVQVGGVLALIDGVDAEGAAVPDSDSGKVDDDRPYAGSRAAGSDAVSDRDGKPVRIKASPLARRLARMRNIDLAAIAGSGRGGRVVKADLPTVPSIDAGRLPRAEGPKAPSEPPASSSLPDKKQTTSSGDGGRTAGHFCVSIDLRLDALVQLRDECNRATIGEAEIALTDLLIKAIGRAFSGVSAAQDRIRALRPHESDQIDVAVEMTLPDRMIAPVISEAGNKRPSEIAAETLSLRASAHDGLLRGDQCGAADLLFSSFADQDVRSVEAILVPPYLARITMGRIQNRPYACGDAIAVAPFATATGSFDRGILDERTAAAVMAKIKRLIDRPLLLLT